MTIQTKHFDTRLNQWIHIDGNTNNPDSLLKEALNNTLLEKFFPGGNFSFGHMDEKSTTLQLKNHPDGHKLLLSSKTRLLYGPEEYLDVIKQLCPDNKDRGAYGSIFLGACKNAVNRELNVLVVDDSNGENASIINNDQAYRLTGDCYGQISTELYHQLTGHQEGDQYRVIQHRFGWTDQDGNDTKYRFGKGTLRPANLDQILNYQDPNNQTKIDLVLPLSAFKGTDKDNPNGATKPQIQPGLYRQNIWLGEKSQSELGKTAISQLLASFPNGVKDFTEQLELEAKRLKEAQDDPRQLAQLYCEKYEKRKAFLEEQATTLEEQAESDSTVAFELETLRDGAPSPVVGDRLTNDSFIYKLIKADLEGQEQLLETEKVQRELARFVQNEWKEIAIGKTLTFERAMVIPSKDLQNGEISIPHYQDGEQVLNFRSPFLNSNGLCVSTNKVVEDILGPDGKPLAGVIAVSDETSDRIYNRLNEQLLFILPEAQGKNIQLEGIENYLDKNIGKLETRDKIEFTNKFNEYIKKLQSAGYELEILPQESEQERQARDYDGDCIGFLAASKYPNLTAEALECNLPENVYAPTVKLKKQSFYQEDGTQPEFEEIAIHMSDGISVGVINNHLTSIEALESEITILKTFGSEKDQIDYVQQVAKHYEDLFKTEAWAKSKGIEGKEVPDKYRASLEEFVQTVRKKPLTQANALFAMNTNTRIYREMIESAAFQNQIAVDLFKSAKKPEMEIIRNNSRILHREVNYIRDKKKDIYIDSTIQPTGYSPVELLIAKTNQYFEKARLESRELVQFQDLFKGVEFSNSQRLQCTVAKRQFDELFNRASELSRQKETEKGPSAIITLANGNQVSVTNLLQYDNELIWKANKITLKLSEIPDEKRSVSRPHKYILYAQINDETENGKPKFRALGTLAKEQENKLEEIGITPGQEVTSNKISFQPELSEGQIKLLYQKAYQAAEEFYNSVPDSEAGRDSVLDQKLAMAAATWAVSTTRESSNEKGNDNQKKVSNFAFAAFSQEIISRLETLQFNEFSITGFDRNSEVFNENQPQNIRFNIGENGKSVIEIQNQEGNYETFGNIEQNNARLPIGTTATASIAKGEVYTASVTTKVPGLPELTFKVGEVNKFGNNSQRFNNEPVMLTIEKVDLIREDYSIYIQNGNNPEKLGNIDKESVKEGIVQGWLAEKPGNGQQLKLKVQTITTRENAYAIAETTEGNLLRINITNPRYKKQALNDQGFRETLVRAFDKKHVYIAKIGDQSLGIIGQHAERLEAELNKGNGQIQWQRKESSTVQKLIDTGIIRSNQQRTTIPVQITSNESTCKITINPETVQYPDRWIKRSQLVSNEQPVRNEQQEKSNQILAKINERPTIMFQDKEQKLVGIVGLAVDEKLAERTKNYLEKVGVSYEHLPASQARLEAKKGMTVFMLDESTISDELKQTFIDRAGGNIKSADTLLQLTPIIPEQTVYFYNPAYIDEEGSQQIKDAVGFVVPAQDAIAVHDWLESKDTENSYIIENDSNTAIFILENNQVGSELQEGLKTLLGEPIGISNGSGFERYESLSQELSERVYQQGSLLSQNQSPELSEYKQALQSLPNRLKKLNQEEAPLGITPAKPVQEENATGTPPALAKLSIGIAGEVPTGQTELQVSILSQKPVATEITQDYRYNPQTNPYFNLPPSTPSATTAEGLDNSPQREAVIAYTPEYSWVSEDYGYSPAIALVVDFREITKARDFLHENGFDFDETLDNTEGFNKGYYEFNLKAKDVSDEQLQLIKKTFQIKTELDNSSKKGSQQEEFTDWLEQQPEVNEEIIKELKSYSSNLYLQHSKLWSEYNQTNVERYIDLNEPPSARFVEFVESIPNLNQEELNTEAQKLTNLELAWIKAATEVENEVPSPTTSSEWSKFVQDTLVNNYPQLASAIESFPSKAVEEVKPILKLEREANTELNGNKLEEALKLKQKAIEKYGEKSFELITQKAEKAFENTQSQEATTSNVAIISFKGINSHNKDAAAGVEITTPDGKKIQISESIGTATGPQAEYKAAILGLKKAQEMGITNIKLEGDSSTVIYQLQDRYQVKSSDLKPLHQEAKTLLSQFQKQEVSFVSNNGKSSSAKKIAETKLNENKLAATRKQVDIVLQNSTATLNEGQKNALRKMVAFSQQPISGNSKDNEFLLTGYAGTGKTYVIQQLLKILKQGEQQTKICFTAPTNSAVKVLREMGESQGIEADTKTTHSLLGLKEKYNEVTGEVFYDRDKKERNNQHLKYDIIVVDESSMINKALREKLEEVAKQGVKVIYMGDDAQVPPVGEPASAVFQIENRADLTEVMRYGGDIGKTAETIRNNIDSTKPEPIRTSEDGTIVALSKDDFKEKIVELFNSKEFKEDNSSVKVIAYTNSRVDQINAFVKEQIFGKNSPEYVPGMRIMARSPVIEDNRENLKTLLHSSEEMTIIKAEKIRENNYNVWVLSGVNEDNKEIEFKAVAQESKLLFAEDVDKLFKIEHSKPLGEREYAVPATYKQQYGDIRLAYAITVHNSQGKTIRKGLVDESNINYRRQLALKEQDPKERERGIREHNQLRYVAMTRFKEQIFVLGDERTQQTELSTPAIALVESNESITLPSARAADPTKAIEILGKVSPDKVEALRSHLETHFKPLLENDKSNYSPGRQVAWVGAKWDLKEKDFKPGVQDDALMALVKQVYPDADIVLVTYSEQPGSGINYHRDDSYAATEARSINIGNSEWGYRAAKEQMAWTKGENPNAQYQEFKLESGIVTRFNCKNEHAALNTEAGRWSINIWSVKNDLGKDNSVREKFENFLASKQSPRAVVNSNDDLTIKSDEWTPGGEIKVKRSYNSLKEATRNTPTPKQNQLTVEEIITIGNQTTGRAQNPQIPENPSIFGKPVPMVYSLLLHGEPPKLPVNTTIDAMRGHGRVHTTRGVDYQKAYGIKEGDIAVALGKNGEQVAFRVSKQYEITPQMIQNPAYQQAWANWEKHSVKELTQTQAQKRRIYGLFMEPLGDYVNGKIVPFPSQCVAQDSAVDGFPNLGNWNASKGGGTVALRVWAGDTCKGVGVPPTVETGAPVQKQPAASVNISPDSKDGLLAALANATALAKEEGKLQNDYQVSVNNNPEAAAGRYGVETHLQKPEGVAYASAEHAFNHQKQLNPSTDEYKLMVEVLQAKLEQHPRLCSAIAERGGTEWLENCTNITNTQDKQWEGKGKDSAFIRALTEVYTNVVEKSQQATVSVAPTNIETKTEVKTQPVKVISGGQAGADMGGLRGAKALGLITGGTAAAGWMTENGANPNLQEYGLVEGEKGSTATETYNKRTVENIRNSDGTAIFGDVNSPGSRFTVQAAQNMGKPVLHVSVDTSLNNRPTAAQQLREFVEQNNIQTLNIAGNRESKAPGLQAAVAEIVQIGLAYQQNKENTRNSPATLDTAEQEKPVVTSEIISPKVQTEKQVAPGINFNSRCPDSLGAVLTSTTVKSKQVGTIQGEYIVSFRDNQAMPAGSYGPETYTQSKPEGQPFLSAEQAFYAYKETLLLGEPRVQLMAEILAARFEQHPRLVEAVTERGGVEWLQQCTYYVSNSKDNFWEGKGEQSPYIRALKMAYINVLEKSLLKEKSPPSPSPVKPPQQTQQPNIEQALASPSHPRTQPVGAMDGIIERMRANTVQNLQDWYIAAQKLNKSENYLSRIQEVTDLYIKENISLEKTFKAMERDIKELEKINEMTSLAQRVVKTIGQEDINGIMSVQTEKYKIATKAQNQTYLVKDKDDNILLYIKEGKIQVNNINDESLQDFQFMNFRIENTLKDIKKDLVER